MEISERLKAVTHEIENLTAADIGTDHAYIPIYACETRKVDKMIACDYHKGPLNIADENIRSFGLTHVIETRLGYGLSPLYPGEVDTVVIAGMGGKLIIEILNTHIAITKSLKQLVLQPQLDTADVRRFIHSIGFKISRERIVYEKNKYYFVLNCQKGEDLFYNETDYLLGKQLVLHKDPLFKKFLSHQIAKHEKIIKYINKNGSGKSDDRLEEVLQLHRIYSEVLMCL